jgi:hypothetical protein
MQQEVDLHLRRTSGEQRDMFKKAACDTIGSAVI